MSPNCTQSLENGKSCNAPAMNGSKFCRHHDPQRPPRPAKEESRESETLVLPSLEDKYSILLALDEIIHALAEGRIKRSVASTLISRHQGLQPPRQRTHRRRPPQARGTGAGRKHEDPCQP
jgi:hypothetical protein